MENPIQPALSHPAQTPSPRAAPRLLRALGALTALGLAVLSACSAIVETDATQCSTDADCAALGAAFAGTTCSADKVCVKGASAGGCSTTQQCIDQLGDFTICRKSDHQCVKLQSTECARVEGDYKNDNAVFLGSVLPTQGADQTTGIAVENSIVLALRDFSQTSGGLPALPGGPTRPLVLVGCSDNSDSNQAVTAARHLVDNVKVPALIGAAFSGITIKMATQVTIPGGVLTISPSATSVAITSLPDNNLVWRTSPSDALQSGALAGLMPQLEAEARTRFSLAPETPLRVMIANKGDSYGKGLAEALVKILKFNGKDALDNGDAFTQFNYGDKDDPASNPTKYPQALSAVYAFKPHVLMVFGTNEAVTEIFQKVEANWDSSTGNEPNKPFYVFADGGLVTEVWDYLKKSDPTDTTRKRVLGTIPGTTNNNYKTFRSLYKSQISDGSSPEVFGAAGAYDATYLLAYAMASLGADPIDGTSIANAMGRLTSGGVIPAGSSTINDAFKALNAGQNIDFDGASGPLNFDLTTGEAPSDIQFWCVPKDASGAATTALTITGAFYDSAQGTVSANSFAALSSSCKW